MLKVRLAQIPDSGHLERKDLELTAQELGLSEAFSGAGVRAGYALDRLGQKVYGRIQAASTARVTCSRCLKDLDLPAASEFQVLFEPGAGGPVSGGDEEAEPDEESVFYRGEELDLGEEIRQELELQVPFAPLCRPACKGLCPECGADLNAGPCGHGGATS